MKKYLFLLLIFTHCLYSNEKTSNNFKAIYDGYLNDSFEYYQKKNYPIALKYLDNAIELNPLIKEAYENKVVINIIINEYTKAITELNKLILNNHKEVTYYELRAYVYALQNKYSDSIKDYEKIIELSQKPKYYYYLGYYYFIENKPFFSIYNYLIGFITDKNAIIQLEKFSIYFYERYIKNKKVMFRQEYTYSYLGNYK